MKKRFHRIFIIFLYTCFLFPYSITALAEMKKKNTKHVYTFIKHSVLHIIKKPNVKYFFTSVTPTGINKNFSTYTYFLITCATEIKNSGNIPPLFPKTTSSPKDLHCFITPTQAKIDNYKARVPISEFLSPLPSVRKSSPVTYRLPSTKITGRKDFNVIPLSSHSHPEKAGNKKIAAVFSIRYCPSNDKSSHYSDLILLSKKIVKKSEDPPFPIPVPGIGKKLKEQCVTLTINNEDPPLPIPVPGIGKELKIREHIFKSLVDGHGAVPTPSDMHLISKELKAAGGYIFAPVTTNAEDHPFPIPVPGIGKGGITSIFRYALIPVNYNKKDIKFTHNDLLLYF